MAVPMAKSNSSCDGAFFSEPNSTPGGWKNRDGRITWENFAGPADYHLKT